MPNVTTVTVYDPTADDRIIINGAGTINNANTQIILNGVAAADVGRLNNVTVYHITYTDSNGLQNQAVDLQMTAAAGGNVTFG